MADTVSGMVVASEEVLSREIRNETVLLDLKTENYFGLDGVGPRIWQLIKDGASLPQIEATLTAEYEVGDEVLTRDLEQFVQDLTQAGLVSLKAGPSAGSAND